jgi:amidase
MQDNIATDPTLGMDTTAGSFALKGSRPKGNADVVNAVRRYIFQNPFYRTRTPL